MSVTAKYSPTVGSTGLFASKPFKKDEVILIEEPLVTCQFSWNKLYGYKACDHCLRPLETVQENVARLTGKPDLIVPYPECCSTDKSSIVGCDKCPAEYCSPGCRSAASATYHRTICVGNSSEDPHPIQLLDEVWRNMHFPPETNTIMLAVRLVARALQSPDPSESMKRTMQFCHSPINEDLQLTHKLLREEFADHIEELRTLMTRIFPQAEARALCGSAFVSLLAMIGTNAQGVATSAVGQWVKRASELPLSMEEKGRLDGFIDAMYEAIDEQSGEFLDNEGVAMFEAQSKCNHSCRPNSQVGFNDNNARMTLTALRDIKEGEEIFISYLDDCALSRSRHSRQKELKENYLFACECEKCNGEIDQPDETSDEDSPMEEGACDGMDEEMP